MILLTIKEGMPLKRNIFVNTIPHSGTHLVTAILDQLNYKHTQLSNKFYSKKPYYRRKQKAGINWRTSTEIGNYLRFFSNHEILVSVASPRAAKASVVANLLSKVQNILSFHFFCLASAVLAPFSSLFPLFSVSFVI